MPGTYQYNVEIKSNVAKLLSDMKQVQNRLDIVEGREYTIKLNIDEKKLSKNALQIAQALKEGELHIYTRDYRANEGKIEIDIRDVNDQELNMIYEKIVKIIGGRKDE